MTEAVTKALRERLDRVRAEHGSGLVDRLMKIGKDCAGHLKEPFRSTAYGDLLYDDKGHPAHLDLGDCFAYALAKAMSKPLLFKGDDFSHTDVASALT